MISALLALLLCTDAGSPSRATLVIGGDVIPHSPLKDAVATAAGKDAEKQTAQWAETLAPLAPLFSTADLVVVNLESPVVDGDRAYEGAWIFSAPLALAAGLKRSGVGAVSFANNRPFQKRERFHEVQVWGTGQDGQGFRRAAGELPEPRRAERPLRTRALPGVQPGRIRGAGLHDQGLAVGQDGQAGDRRRFGKGARRRDPAEGRIDLRLGHVPGAAGVAAQPFHALERLDPESGTAALDSKRLLEHAPAREDAARLGEHQ